MYNIENDYIYIIIRNSYKYETYYYIYTLNFKRINIYNIIKNILSYL